MGTIPVPPAARLAIQRMTLQEINVREHPLCKRKATEPLDVETAGNLPGAVVALNSQ